MSDDDTFSDILEDDETFAELHIRRGCYATAIGRLDEAAGDLRLFGDLLSGRTGGLDVGNVQVLAEHLRVAADDITLSVRFLVHQYEGRDRAAHLAQEESDDDGGE